MIRRASSNAPAAPAAAFGRFLQTVFQGFSLLFIAACPGTRESRSREKSGRAAGGDCSLLNRVRDLPGGAAVPMQALLQATRAPRPWWEANCLRHRAANPLDVPEQCCGLAPADPRAGSSAACPIIASGKARGQQSSRPTAGRHRLRRSRRRWRNVIARLPCLPDFEPHYGTQNSPVVERLRAQYRVASFPKPGRFAKRASANRCGNCGNCGNHPSRSGNPSQATTEVPPPATP